MNNTVDKLQPSKEELAELRQFLEEEPRVLRSEVADELGCRRSAVSRFLSGERKSIAGGGGVHTFREAVRRIRARKAASEVAA